MNIKQWYSDLGKKEKVATIVIPLCIIVMGISWYYWISNQDDITLSVQGEIEYGATKDELKKSFIHDGDEIDYGNLDIKKVGKQEINIKVCKNQKCKTFVKNIEVKDTQAPIIDIEKENINILKGSDYSLLDNIKVSDKIDGEINYIEKKTIKENQRNYFTIDTDFDINTPNEYTIKVIALDINGNKSEKGFKVVVEKNAEESKNSENLNNDNIGSQNNQVGNTTPNVNDSNNLNNNGTGNSGSSDNGSSNSNTNNVVTPTPPTPPVDNVVCPNAIYDESKPCDWYPPISGSVVFGTKEAADAYASEVGERYGGLTVQRNDGTILYVVKAH